MRRKRLGRSQLLVLGLLAELAGVQGVAAHRPPGDLPNHELVFSGHSDAARKDYDLWRVCADGTQMASLVVAPDHQLQVAIAPSGEEFLYSSKVEGAWDVWRKPFGRGEAVNLTAHPARDSEAIWSPSGNRIAFFSDRDTEKLELYLLDLDDDEGEPERLTSNEYHDSGAAWSPGGEEIVFTRYFPAPDGAAHAGRGEIVRLDLESGVETQLTDLGGYNGGLSYSPDGSTLAFHRSAEEGVEIWLMAADGSSPRALTATTIDEYSPAWSPDGRWIAFTAGSGNDGAGTFDLWLMRADGTDRRILLAGPNTEAWQDWRPGHPCR